MAYIEAKNIHKTFGKGDAAVHALRGASLSVDKGEMVAVMGKSGSGKSTLLNILGGLMTMDEGELRVGGKKVDFRKKKYLLNYRRREVGFVVQYFALIDDMNVYKNVSLPLRYQGIPGAKIRQRTTKMLRNFVKADGVAQSFIDKKGGIEEQVVGGGDIQFCRLPSDPPGQASATVFLLGQDQRLVPQILRGDRFFLRQRSVFSHENAPDI